MADDLLDDDPYARAERGFRSVALAIDAGVARVTLGKPPANVLSVELLDELARALESIEYEREVKLVVLQAAPGSQYFSAGFNVRETVGENAYSVLEGFRRATDALIKCDKPTLSVVAAPAFGAGAMLAAACDLCYVGAQKGLLRLPEVLGGSFNTVAAALLPRLVGRRKAFELMLGGAQVAPAEAERIGLVTKAVPDDRLEAEVAALVQRFQAQSAPVLQSARRALHQGFDIPLGDATLAAEDVYLNQLLASEDAGEGLKAILEKRPPQWKDR